MAVQWTVDGHVTRGAKRSISLKRVVNGDELTAQSMSHTFHINDSKAKIKAKFKELFLARKAKKVELDAIIKNSDLATFETEVNS